MTSNAPLRVTVDGIGEVVVYAVTSRSYWFQYSSADCEITLEVDYYDGTWEATLTFEDDTENPSEYLRRRSRSRSHETAHESAATVLATLGPLVPILSDALKAKLRGEE